MVRNGADGTGRYRTSTVLDNQMIYNIKSWVPYPYRYLQKTEELYLYFTYKFLITRHRTPYRTTVPGTGTSGKSACSEVDIDT
jgi:hypothetical protein